MIPEHLLCPALIQKHKHIWKGERLLPLGRRAACNQSGDVGWSLGKEGWKGEIWAAHEGTAGSREIAPGCGLWERYHETALHTEWEFSQIADLYPVLVLPQA